MDTTTLLIILIVLLVLGGGGLIIKNANSYPEVPLLGINFGNVGFLALIERRDWQRAIDALQADPPAPLPLP